MALTAAEILLRVKAKDEATGVLNSVAKTAQNVGSKMGTALKVGGLAAAGGIGLAIGASVKFVGAASNMQESMSKVNVVFGQNAQAVQKWSQTSAKAFGASRQEALEAAGSFGNLFTAMGVGQKEAADLSTSLVELAADFASFNNIGVDEALEKLRAGLVGETEPMRTLGVNLNAAAVEAYILERGIAATKDEITDAMKVQARYNLILEQSKNAQGDFARTSGGLANQQRILSAVWKDMQVTLGNALLPLMTALTTALATFLVDHQADIERFSQLFSEKLLGAIEAVARAFENAEPVFARVFDSLKEGFDVIQPPLEWILNNDVAIAGAFTLIGIAALAALTPMGIKVAAIAAGLGAIVFVLGEGKKAWEEFTEANDRAKEKNDGSRDSLILLEAVLRGVGWVLQESARGWGIFAEAVVDVMFKLGELEYFLVNNVDNAIRGIIDSNRGLIDSMRNVGAVGEAVYGAVLAPVIRIVWINIRDLWTLMQGFGSDFAVIGRGVAEGFVRIWGAVQGVIGAIKQLIDWLGKIPQPGDFLPSIPSPGFSIPKFDFTPGFATGTPYVPRDMLAMVHRGEAIIPASQNRGSWGGVNVQIDIANVEGNVDAGMVDRLANVITGRVESVLHADTFGGMAVNTAPFAA